MPYFSIVSTPLLPAFVWPMEPMSSTLSLKSLPKTALMFLAASATSSKPICARCELA